MFIVMPMLISLSLNPQGWDRLSTLNELRSAQNQLADVQKRRKFLVDEGDRMEKELAETTRKHEILKQDTADYVARKRAEKAAAAKKASEAKPVLPVADKK